MIGERPSIESADKQADHKTSIQERAKMLGKEEAFVALQFRARKLEREIHKAHKIPTEAIKTTVSASARVLDEMLEIALAAREFSDQYRGFDVGGVVLGVRKTQRPTDNPWLIMFDANTKPTREDKKHCAELYLMDRIQAAESGIEKVLTFVVVGEPQQDDDSKRKQITLTPCILCRDRMAHMAKEKTPIDANTEVINADAERLWIRKYQKVKDLHGFHGERNEHAEF